MFDHTTRRRFVVAAGALTTATLAGCADFGSDGDDETNVTSMDE
ncbi:hypothetical protein ACFR97_08275 [Haloplanus litoreus]|uniref:TAT (Twin-arginine translocation) pathway signal sequence n=1 Tax=Haloplanus litoreus TaxID=767515 RepID=A0ABD5ZVS8_9EURY